MLWPARVAEVAQLAQASAKLQAGRFLSLSVVVRVTLHRRAAERVRALEVRKIGEARTIVRDDEVLALALVAAARHVNVSRSRFERVVEQVAERRSVRVVLGCVPNSAKVQPRGRSLRLLPTSRPSRTAASIPPCPSDSGWRGTGKRPPARVAMHPWTRLALRSRISTPSASGE